MKLREPLVGWFHLGSEETANARAFLRLCNGEDSVDELGFGILRDGFSEEFFPGTSTVMTETRYLIFLAAIYRFMERSLQRKKGAIPDALERSRRMQDQLRDVLSATFQGRQGNGVIGISVKEPERYPSTIYWAGLRTLGILKFADGAEGDYLRTLPRYHDLIRVDDSAEDAIAEVEPPPLNWDRRVDDIPGVIDDKGRFADGLNFELTGPEASYLRDCYLGVDRASPPENGIHKSLLAHLIEKRRKSAFQFPWDVSPPPHLQEAVDDAKHFSALARGATLQYYHLLIEARRAEGLPIPEADIKGWLRRWWDEARPCLLNWNENEFLVRRRRDLRPSRKDSPFVVDWLGRCRAARSERAFLSDSEAQRLIGERELLCKQRKARLRFKEFLGNWKQVPRETDSPFQLNFRAQIGGVFVRRIVSGLETAAVNGKMGRT